MNIFSVDWLNMTSDAYWYQYPGNIRLPRWTGKGRFSFQSQRRAMPKNIQTTAQLHSPHASKVMLKIHQSRLQQYVNWELPDVQAGFRKGRGIRDQISNIHWIIENAREFQKNINFLFIDYAKAFDCVDHNKLWKVLKEMVIPNHLTCLLWNLYAGQEATVRTRHGTMDWFKIGKGVQQGWILLPCLFNLYTKFSSVQSLSRVQLFATPWIAARQASLFITISRSISSEMLVLMNHELESRLLGETSTISDIQMELKNLFSEEKLKNLLMRVKEVSE